MKRILLAVLFGLAAVVPGALRAQTNVVVFSYGNFAQVAQVGRVIMLYPLYLNSVNPAGITTLDQGPIVTGADGTASATNMLAGLYRGEFKGTRQTTTNWFTIPDDQWNGLGEQLRGLYLCPGWGAPCRLTR